MGLVEKAEEESALFRYGYCDSWDLAFALRKHLTLLGFIPGQMIQETKSLVLSDLSGCCLPACSTGNIGATNGAFPSPDKVQNFASTVVVKALLTLALHCMVNQWFKNCIGWKPIFCLHLSLSALKWPSDTHRCPVHCSQHHSSPQGWPASWGCAGIFLMAPGSACAYLEGRRANNSSKHC